MNQDKDLIFNLRNWVGMFMRLSMHHLMQYSHESGLSMQQIRVLFLIHRCPRCITNIGEHLGITKAAASQMIDKMVAQGFITRVEDLQDRRSKHISLTEKGLLAMKNSLEARQGWLENLASRFSPEEGEQIAHSLSVLVEQARQLEIEV